MNYLSLLSDPSLETIAKYTPRHYKFIILRYCSTPSSEQILYYNVKASGSKYIFHITLSYLVITMHNKSTADYKDCANFISIRDGKSISSVFYYFCKKCSGAKLKLRKCLPEYNHEIKTIINCYCKN